MSSSSALPPSGAPPPGAATKKSGAGSAATNPNPPTTVDERRSHFALRMRTDSASSTGSTRGAFGGLALHPPKEHHYERHPDRAVPRHTAGRHGSSRPPTDPSSVLVAAPPASSSSPGHRRSDSKGKRKRDRSSKKKKKKGTSSSSSKPQAPQQPSPPEPPTTARGGAKMERGERLEPSNDGGRELLRGESMHDSTRGAFFDHSNGTALPPHPLAAGRSASAGSAGPAPTTGGAVAGGAGGAFREAAGRLAEGGAAGGDTSMVLVGPGNLGEDNRHYSLDSDDDYELFAGMANRSPQSPHRKSVSVDAAAVSAAGNYNKGGATGEKAEEGGSGGKEGGQRRSVSDMGNYQRQLSAIEDGPSFDDSEESPAGRGTRHQRGSSGASAAGQSSLGMPTPGASGGVRGGALGTASPTPPKSSNSRGSGSSSRQTEFQELSYGQQRQGGGIDLSRISERTVETMTGHRSSTFSNRSSMGSKLLGSQLLGDDEEDVEVGGQQQGQRQQGQQLGYYGATGAHTNSSHRNQQQHSQNSHGLIGPPMGPPTSPPPPVLSPTSQSQSQSQQQHTREGSNLPPAAYGAREQEVAAFAMIASGDVALVPPPTTTDYGSSQQQAHPSSHNGNTTAHPLFRSNQQQQQWLDGGGVGGQGGGQGQQQQPYQNYQLHPHQSNQQPTAMLANAPHHQPGSTGYPYPPPANYPHHGNPAQDPPYQYYPNDPNRQHPYPQSQYQRGNKMYDDPRMIQHALSMDDHDDSHHPYGRRSVATATSSRRTSSMYPPGPSPLEHFSQACQALGTYVLYYIDPQNLFYEPYEDERPEDHPVGPIRQTLRTLLYDPYEPEFTSLQQHNWAVLLGVFMGVFTALWGFVIEFCVSVVWEKVPERLLEWGLFSEADGWFPMAHYMWICPAIFGGILSYISVVIPKPIPGQNEWIESLHTIGVQDSSTFLHLVLISTAGMASGLSLGPELPLVLSSGMVGSYLALLTRQSILTARVMNLTAAGAAVGGFFGFPMAGALFVLEIPHRMGLQYFEALSPATIASIVAVLVNRMVTGNDVTGYFKYPFLSSSLPSEIFYIAVLFGLFGSLCGVAYTKATLYLKMAVHDWFHEHEHAHAPEHKVHTSDPDLKQEAEKAAATMNGNHGYDHGHSSETVPLVVPNGQHSMKKKHSDDGALGTFKTKLDALTSLTIKSDPTRAAVNGTIAGALTGLICMFVPHALFWGEAQLQTLIDKGQTPLPIFGRGEEPTAALTAYGFCMIDPEDDVAVASGFSLACAGVLVVTKVLVIGLSLGTGIVGGHFWGPLFVGCAASHFFTDVMEILTRRFGGYALRGLSGYPCVAILCIMGSAHVVTFRAHMAIMLILTLTISSFEDSNGWTESGGDYSAVFPLLVVSCFISLMVTRSTVFYKKQRCRGDIIASPQVLCEPNKEGMPTFVDYGPGEDEIFSESMYSDEDDGSETMEDTAGDTSSGFEGERELVKNLTQEDIEREFSQKARGHLPETQDDIEREFLATKQGTANASRSLGHDRPLETQDDIEREFAAKQGGKDDARAQGDYVSKGDENKDPLPSKRLDELLAAPVESSARRGRSHRRAKSTGSDALLSKSGNSVPSGGPHRTRSSSLDRRSRSKSHSRKSSVDSGINMNVTRSNRERADSQTSRASTPTQAVLARVSSFGDVSENYQPSLLGQARRRASSISKKSVPPMNPKTERRHSRKNSASSLASSFTGVADVSATLSSDGHGIGRSSSAPSPVHSRMNSTSSAGFANITVGEIAGSLSMDDIEKSFSDAMNEKFLASQFGGTSQR